MPILDPAPVVLLGRLDLPTDGVRDYCSQLSEAFVRRGEHLDIVEMRWENQGWPKAVRQLWKNSRQWRGRWVLFQYTALMWSRRGFPICGLAALWILKLRGAKICVVFHDIRYDQAREWKQRIRVAFQYRTMRLALQWAVRCVLTVPASQVPWLGKNSEKVVFIPVGSGIPEMGSQFQNRGTKLDDVPTVAVFGVTGGAQAEIESEDISYVTRRAIAKSGNLRLVIIGRGSSEAESILRRDLEGSGVDLSTLGVLPPDQIRENLAKADVLLCIRGHISSRRSSAMAGIVCGLPIIGYHGEETAFPITEAGVLLVESGDRDGVAEALWRVLSDGKLREELHQRSVEAEKKYFSWDAIATQFLRVLADR